MAPRTEAARAMRKAQADEPAAGIPFFTIMLDVSANLLCVVVLIVMMAATTQPGRRQAADVTVPVIAGEVLTPARLVEAFRLRTLRVEGTATIDLLPGHVEVKPGGAAPFETIRIPLGDAGFAAKLRGALGWATAGINVYVFDQNGHALLRRSLEETGTVVTEIDVPLALRASGPQGGWSESFEGLIGRALEPEPFRLSLARIIAGGAGAPGATEPIDGARGARPRGAVWTALHVGWRLSLLLLAAYAISRIGRMRPRLR